MSDRTTPETDAFSVSFKSIDDPLGQKQWVPADLARRLEHERDEARDVLEEISLYLSSGIGDENTTAQQYKERILDGIKHLAGHAWEERCKFERERDEARRKLSNLDVTAIHSCHNECQRPVCVLRRERDEAREKLSARWRSLRDSQDEVLRLTFENRKLRNLINE